MVPPGALALRSVKESWSQWSLRRGLQSLPEALADFLQRSGKVELHTGAPVRQIHPSAAAWKVWEEAGTETSQKSLLSCCQGCDVACVCADLRGGRSRVS